MAPVWLAVLLEEAEACSPASEKLSFRIETCNVLNLDDRPIAFVPSWITDFAKDVLMFHFLASSSFEPGPRGSAVDADETAD